MKISLNKFFIHLEYYIQKKKKSAINLENSNKKYLIPI